jgi:drug/metabolite transporter (DMT)-like permease
VILLFALAIYLARGFRRETLRNIGWAFVLVGITVLVLRRVGGNYVVNELVAVPNRPVMHDVWLTVTSILGSIGRGVVLYGIFAIVGAVLAGPTRAATAVRRWMAPTLNFRPGMAWAIAGFLYLLLVLWGPTHELHEPAWIVILAAMVAFGVYALRKETLREFPDAQPGGFVAAVRSAWDRLQGGGSNGDDSVTELARLGEMRQQGLITDDEFAQAKARALA